MIDDLMKHYGEHKDLFYDRLETALREARNQALEEAAKLADVEASTGEYTGDLAREGQHRNMAIRIRQLKHKDGQP